MYSIVGISFIMGLISSLHCVGMCGPLVIALPLHDTNFKNRISNGLLYHAGRISTYVLAGGVAGIIGNGFFAGVAQQKLSLAMGVMMLLFVLMKWGMKKINGGLAGRTDRFFWSVRQAVSEWPLIRKNHSVFILGLLNGLLPCGVVYLAISSAVAAGSFGGGMLYMLFFGLGTTPALFSVGLMGNSFTMKWRIKFQKAVPGLLTIVACLLILRGLNLGISYLSPEMKSPHAGCCVKPG